MMTNNFFSVNEYQKLNLDFNAKREYLNSRGMQLRVTSGSTGKPVEVIKSDRDNKNDYLLQNYYTKVIFI